VTKYLLALEAQGLSKSRHSSGCFLKLGLSAFEDFSIHEKHVVIEEDISTFMKGIIGLRKIFSTQF
jgi:hypothetical protein